MNIDLRPAITYAGAHPVPAAGAAVLALVAFLLAWRILRAGARAARGALQDHRPEDVLTLVAAVIATTVQAMGMWRFFDVTLHVDGPLRTLLAAFIEVAMFTEALRARRNILESEDHTAGVDGAAVWALAGLSAVLSSLDARTFAEATFRLAIPTVAAWLWERLMAADRRRTKTARRINWRITPERVLVWLGLAEAADRTAVEVDAHRKLTRVARAAYRLRVLTATGARAWRINQAGRRLDAAMRAAVEHTGLAVEQVRQDALMAQLGALYNAQALAQITPAAPWGTPGTRIPALYRVPNPELRRAEAELSGVEETYDDPFPDTPAELTDWLDDADVPGVPLDPDPHQVLAAGEFADEVIRGKVPGIRTIKQRLRLGQPKAQEVREYLTVLANQ